MTFLSTPSLETTFFVNSKKKRTLLFFVIFWFDLPTKGRSNLKKAARSILF